MLLSDGQKAPSRLGTDAPPKKGRISQRETTGEINRSFLPGIFLRNLERGVMARYSNDTRHLCSHVRSRLVQFWFGADRAIHYEVWIHDRTAQMELGLHFESTPARNRELFRRFDAELLSIQAVLGPTIWLEEWDRGWSRIYETQP